MPIPPRTMRDVWRDRRQRQKNSLHSPCISLKLDAGFFSTTKDQTISKIPVPTKGFQKPRNWKFQTKPVFKKIKGLLVDVFHEADEVLIVIDLGGFSLADIRRNITQKKYSIYAKKGDQEFVEEIVLPEKVDFSKCRENFRNGVLEIILPKKKKDIT